MGQPRIALSWQAFFAENNLDFCGGRKRANRIFTDIFGAGDGKYNPICGPCLCNKMWHQLINGVGAAHSANYHCDFGLGRRHLEIPVKNNIERGTAIAGIEDGISAIASTLVLKLICFSAARDTPL